MNKIQKTINAIEKFAEKRRVRKLQKEVKQIKKEIKK